MAKDGITKTTLRSLAKDFCIIKNPKTQEILKDYNENKLTYEHAHRKLMDIYSETFLRV